MGLRVLRGSDDREPPQEASAIERANRVFGRRPVTEIYWSLMNASQRSSFYQASVDVEGEDSKLRRSLEIERRVEDRLLDEALANPVYRQHLGLA